MAHNKERPEQGDPALTPSDIEHYKQRLRELQIELVKFQRHLIKFDHKVLVLFEGRDAAGKDGAIKRIVQHLSPRDTRVVALGKPSEKDVSSWYFQRYVSHLPSSQEMVLLNRSWYNRAGVERVMGFCSGDQYHEFMATVIDFEHLLVRSGIQVFKYYLDVSKKEQRKRLRDRKTDPLKQWKTSPIDAVAIKHWDDYTAARDAMLEGTHNAVTPWYIVRADNKKLARLNIIRDLMRRVECPDKDEHAATPDREIVFPYESRFASDGTLAR
ncbi:MAG: polyphosphate kinase 2 [Novosphingobium sp.]|uniref:ADP/GDP-polyphosphate phosphotransferase n=1 Tax=Tsuneonella suprasediminis TaxID=2306996 RepID=A0A419R4Z5_9SPHN|nr:MULTISPECIES: polyphosphate kinase 2 [Sphingomonadales]MAC58379.1 polyphosphate kinase 2 [Novosphingobium sp.]RJX70350.1 polyphosphate kinase 2 [Tsuneonella suprasediminis]